MNSLEMDAAAVSESCDMMLRAAADTMEHTPIMIQLLHRYTCVVMSVCAKGVTCANWCVLQ